VYCYLGADLEISTNDSGEVNVIYLQDSEMKLFFEKYPELVLVDATYKLTNVHMALYVMLCIGPNGESEIVAVFLSTLEDTQSLRVALQQFKQRNSNWTQIKTVITDKDMAERDAIRQEFGQASLLLCIFHVLRSMSREITTTKMGITEPQRASALRAMQSLAYATTEVEYDSLRDHLHSSMPASVVRYFEANWHTCRCEWVLCWQRENVTFGERTNNRLESVNRRLKAVVKNGSSLPVFFKDLVATIACMRHERDHSFVNAIDKVSTRPYPAGSAEAQFRECLTPFALRFTVKQLSLSTAVEMAADDEGNITTIVDGQEAVVTVNDCLCSFWRTIGLPCRHVFAARQYLQQPLFTTDGIWKRWLKEDVAGSHRVFKTLQASQPLINVSHSATRPLTLSEKFQSCRRVVQRLSQLACECGTQQFFERLQVLDKLQKLWEQGSIACVTELTDDAVVSIDTASASVDDILQCASGDSTVNANECDSDVVAVSAETEAVAVLQCVMHDVAAFTETESATVIPCATQNDAIVEGDVDDSVSVCSASQSDDVDIMSSQSVPEHGYCNPVMQYVMHDVAAFTDTESATVFPCATHNDAVVEGNVDSSVSVCSALQSDNVNIMSSQSVPEHGYCNPVMQEVPIIQEVYLETSASVNAVTTSENLQSENRHAQVGECSQVQSLQFPPTAKVRGRPRLQLKKTAIGQTRSANKMCLPYNQKRVDERTSTLLRSLVIGIRPEDIDCTNPVSPQHLRLRPDELPSIILHEDVVLNVIKPLLTSAAWKKLTSAVRIRKRMSLWKCACCNRDTAETNCVECDSCLEWYHWECVGIERCPRNEWFCYICRMNL